MSLEAGYRSAVKNECFLHVHNDGVDVITILQLNKHCVHAFHPPHTNAKHMNTVGKNHCRGSEVLVLH